MSEKTTESRYIQEFKEIQTRILDKYEYLIQKLERGEADSIDLAILDKEAVIVCTDVDGTSAGRIHDAVTRAAAIGEIMVYLRERTSHTGAVRRLNRLILDVTLYDRYPLIHRSDLSTHERGISADAYASLNRAIDDCRERIAHGEPAGKPLDLSTLEHEDDDQEEDTENPFDRIECARNICNEAGAVVVGITPGDDGDLRITIDRYHPEHSGNNVYLSLTPDTAMALAGMINALLDDLQESTFPNDLWRRFNNARVARRKWIVRHVDPSEIPDKIRALSPQDRQRWAETGEFPV